ncbi:MAG: GHKL domain-containing protein [Clostridia bacterium]|nr:GHKL domain-containing protein [Clostridia bacterium]MBQ3258291.1 GHKL domain-containing protein [Oscillospiraceae bacterium]
MKRNEKTIILILLITSILFSFLLQLLCYRYDNKYTNTRPAAENGRIRLNTEWYDTSPFFYLIEGWSFYDGKLLTPQDIDAHTPDDHFYIGRYGGLNRSDMTRSAAGQATYRMVIETDGIPRTFSLELCGVYDKWKLWVNGDLVQSVGYPENDAFVSHGSVVTFTAADEIELIAAVESDGRNFYSGMVYPPAIGSQDKIAHISALRLLIHASVCAVTILIGILCLLLFAGNKQSAHYGYLTLLCIFFCGMTAWPIYQYFGLTGGWYVWERVCSYGMFLSLVLLQNRLCRIPRKVSVFSASLGMLVCLAVLMRPMIPFPTAAVNLAWSRVLTVYKWLTACYLIFCTGWAVVKNARYSVPLLAGSCAFAAALIMNRLLPMHEPVLFGWNTEIAGFVWICLLTGIVGYDAIRTYREREKLKHEQAISEIRLAAQTEHARLQQEYIRATRENLHESRSRLTLIRHYSDTGSYDSLKSYLNELSGDSAGLDSRQYTGNSLADAILTLVFARAEKIGVYIEREFGSLKEDLSIRESDLTTLLMNITENALEALERIDEPEDRWMRLRLDSTDELLTVECENAALMGEKQFVKADRQAHGFGLPLIRSVAASYGGNVQIEQQEESFLITVSLPITPKPLQHG